MDLKAKLREVPDFPKEGINFIDITTVLQDPEALKECIDSMKKKVESFGSLTLLLDLNPEDSSLGHRWHMHWEKVLYLSGKRESFRTRQSVLNMSLSMARTYLRCI